MRVKIAVGGFQHETNTFAPMKADWAAFEQADSWPAMQIGDDVLSACRGMNIPVAGFVETATSMGDDLLPLSWCSATPSGYVTSDAYDRFSAMLLEQLSDVAKDIDALYLDLHGAMVAEHLEDGEGILLKKARDIVGADVWVVASLDLHANVTNTMVDTADFLSVFRTYPHVDMALTGTRTAQALHQLARSSKRPAKALRKLDFLIPLTGSCTLEEPASSIYQSVSNAEKSTGVWGASFATGFAPADIWENGPSILVYGETQQVADDMADELASLVASHEADFSASIWTAEEAITHVGDSRTTNGPVVLADTQDNPGAGGNGDTVGILKALIDANVGNAVLGVLYDPVAADAAHEAGEGATIQLKLGAHTGGAVSEKPIEAAFNVLALSDGEFVADGPYYDGVCISLGPTALIENSGVQVVVGSKKVQCADRAMFTHIGCELKDMNIVAVKSSVHFRADFSSLASEILVVASPGPNPSDHRELDYVNLRPAVRLMPGAKETS
jgi:microcystin degradation protein MlrC